MQVKEPIIQDVKSFLKFILLTTFSNVLRSREGKGEVEPVVESADRAAKPYQKSPQPLVLISQFASCIIGSLVEGRDEYTLMQGYTATHDKSVD